MPALKATALRDFLEILDVTGTRAMVNYKILEQTFYYMDRSVEFFPIDNEAKMRGRKRDILWINEANEIEYKTDFIQLAIRTTSKIILDFNPSEFDSWIKTELEEKRKDEVRVIHSTYKDNPFLTGFTMNEIENLKKVDPDLYKVFTLGEYAKIAGLIYPNWEIMDWEVENYRDVYYGLDFGYANDPTCLVKIYDIGGNEFVVEEKMYDTGLTSADIANRYTPEARVIADPRDGRSIEDLKRLGWRISAAKAGPGSVLNGIMAVKSKKVFIHHMSRNIIDESGKYKWITDSKGDPTNEPIKRYDHAMDAIRYGIQYYNHRGGFSLIGTW